jgi:hypothetical protein
MLAGSLRVYKAGGAAMRKKKAPASLLVPLLFFAPFILYVPLFIFLFQS